MPSPKAPSVPRGWKRVPPRGRAVESDKKMCMTFPGRWVAIPINEYDIGDPPSAFICLIRKLSRPAPTPRAKGKR